MKAQVPSPSSSEGNAEVVQATLGASCALMVLAAGASSRMGRPKLLLPWGGTSLLGHLLAQGRSLGMAQMAVVLADRERDGADRHGLARELDRLAETGVVVDRIHNPDPVRGMFSSIQTGAGWDGWRSGLTHWLISLGDQPLVRLGTWRQLLEAGLAHPAAVCQPARGSRPRHPVLLPAREFRRAGASLEPTFKQFLLAQDTERFCFESDDTGLDLDLDYPADYVRARQIAGI